IDVTQGRNSGFRVGGGGNPLHFDSGRSHDIGLKLKPADTLSIGALYVLCQCTRLAHAFDLVADWTPTERVKMSLGGGVAMAGLSDPQPVPSASVSAALQAQLRTLL